MNKIKLSKKKKYCDKKKTLFKIVCKFVQVYCESSKLDFILKCTIDIYSW